MHRVITTRPTLLVKDAGADVTSWLTYPTTSGLESLRALLGTASTGHHGIEVVGEFGLTSHIGELLATASVPIRLRTPTA
jgi:hypothetical protein